MPQKMVWAALLQAKENKLATGGIHIKINDRRRNSMLKLKRVSGLSVFGCEKFYRYVYGLPTLPAETDHKLLVSVIEKNLIDIAFDMILEQIVQGTAKDLKLQKVVHHIHNRWSKGSCPQF